MTTAFKIKKICAGYYVVEEKDMVISKLEEGSYRNWWIVSKGRDHSDPIPTYKESKAVAINWANES